MTQFRPDYYANIGWNKEPFYTLDMQPENYSHLKRALNSAGKTAAQESIVEAGVASTTHIRVMFIITQHS